MECNELYSAVYRHSPVGLVVVNEFTELVDANEYMFKIFLMNQQHYKGKHFGNVFNCSVVAGTLEECGTAEACLDCDLRAGVVNVLNCDAIIDDATMNHDFTLNGVDTKKWFKISASPISADGEKYGVISFVDITKEKQYEELLFHELTLDLFTGTLNKYNLIEILKGLIQNQDGLSIVSIGLIDFDDFKLINDNYGHLKGDEVLSEFSEVSRKVIRRQDVIGRFGGEEFMFIFPGVGVSIALDIIQRISTQLKEKFNKTILGGVSFSAGFLEIDREKLKMISKDEVIEVIDSNLYQAKRLGKHRFIAEGIEQEM